MAATLRAGADSAPVSGLVLGTAGMGREIDEAASARILDRYLDAGGNCLDTARAYRDGAGEELLGRYLRRTGKRSRVLVASKGGFPHAADKHRSRLSAAELTADLEQSLRALQVDTIDLYYLHRDDTSYPVGHFVELLAGFVRSGKVRFLGASNWSAARLEEANAYALAHGLPAFAASQIQWSLAETTPTDWGDDTMLCMNARERAFYDRTKLPVMAYSPLARGFFQKLAACEDPAALPDAFRPFAGERNRQRCRRAQAMSRELGVTLNQLCLAWVQCAGLHACAVVGCKTAAHAEEAMGAAGLVLTQQQAAWLLDGEHSAHTGGV